MSKMTVTADAKPMLNAYPDSVGGTLSDITGFLQKPELKDVFSSFYILPSVFNTDLDRGFSVIDYTLNEELADKKDLEALEELGINLKLDFILNHASVLSRQFQDILKNGVLRSKICSSLSVSAKLGSATWATKLGAWSPAMATMTLRPVFSFCAVK